MQMGSHHAPVLHSFGGDIKVHITQKHLDHGADVHEPETPEFLTTGTTVFQPRLVEADSQSFFDDPQVRDYCSRILTQ